MTRKGLTRVPTANLLELLYLLRSASGPTEKFFHRGNRLRRRSEATPFFERLWPGMPPSLKLRRPSEYVGPA